MPRRKPANYLRTRRLAWGLTQPELGLLLGVSKAMISKYENDICHIPPPRLLAVELIFGVNTLELLSDLRARAEDVLARRALRLYQQLEGKTDPVSHKKRLLLEGLPARLSSATFAP